MKYALESIALNWIFASSQDASTWQTPLRLDARAAKSTPLVAMFQRASERERERRRRAMAFYPCRAPKKHSDLIIVTSESQTGRNLWFLADGRRLSRAALVAEIKAGLHPHYHVRVIHGIE